MRCVSHKTERAYVVCHSDNGGGGTLFYREYFIVCSSAYEKNANECMARVEVFGALLFSPFFPMRLSITRSFPFFSDGRSFELHEDGCGGLMDVSLGKGERLWDPFFNRRRCMHSIVQFSTFFTPGFCSDFDGCVVDGRRF